MRDLHYATSRLALQGCPLALGRLPHCALNGERKEEQTFSWQPTELGLVGGSLSFSSSLVLLPLAKKLSCRRRETRSRDARPRLGPLAGGRKEES